MKPFSLLFVSLFSMGAVQACEVRLSQGNVDYGQLNRTTLKAQEGAWRLPPRRLSVLVLCDAPQELALSFRALAKGLEGFALGAHGEYRLTLRQALLDGEPVNLGLQTGQAFSQARVEQVLSPNRVVVPVRAGAVAQGRQLGVQVQVDTWADERALQVSDATFWQAAGRFEVAGQQRELTVSASFAPAACRPHLGGGGLVDFGRIPAQRLAVDAQTKLSRRLSLNVACDGPTRFALSAVDNRAGSPMNVAGQPSGSLFNSNLGALATYTAHIYDDPVGDGALLQLVQGRPGGQYWHAGKQAAGASLHHDGLLLGFAQSGNEAAGPVAVTHLRASVGVDLYLAPLSQWRLTEDVQLDGAATVQITYL